MQPRLAGLSSPSRPTAWTPTEHTGWSVAIVGQARAVTDGAEIRRLEAAVPLSWVTGESDHFIRISPAMVNGRRVTGRRLTGGISARRF